MKKANKKTTKKVKQKVPTRKVVSVNVKYIHGQSFYPRPVFEGIYYLGKNEEIAKSISQNVTPYWADGMEDRVFIDCFDEELKLELISSVMKDNLNCKIVSKPLYPGAGFGYNVSIKQIEKELEI